MPTNKTDLDNQKNGVPNAEELRKRILSNVKTSFASVIRGKQLSSSLGDAGNSLPPILQSNFEIPQSHPNQYVADFEDLTLGLRHFAFGLPSVAGCPKLEWLNSVEPPSCDAKTIEEAVKKAAAQLNDLSYGGHDAVSLKLVGVRIKHDIDLSKLRLPFSLRLIGCILEGSLILDRTDLVTLDLSGSIIKGGISGNYMKAEGALRARRSVFLAPVDLGGCTIGGVVDFSDAILFPKNKASAKSSYVADRGILNLALTRLEKDCRFARSRIYGGINMRGAKVGGFLHFNDAVLRCPIAHFELMAHACVTKLKPDPSNEQWDPAELSIASRASFDADVDLANMLHQCEECQSAFSIKTQTEILGGDDLLEAIWTPSDQPPGGRSLFQPVQFALLQESRRTAESALRLEGAEVDGPIYGFGLRVSGRVRMKGIVTGGGISFNGSRFRTVRAIKSDIATRVDFIRRAGTNPNEHLDFIRRGLIAAQSDPTFGLHPDVKAFRVEYVVDLRDARVSGPLDFGADQRSSRPLFACDEMLKEELAGVLATTGEDPAKFISVFSSLKNNFSGRQRPEEAESADALRMLGELVDGEFYDRLKDLEAASDSLDELNASTKPPDGALTEQLQEERHSLLHLAHEFPLDDPKKRRAEGLDKTTTEALQRIVSGFPRLNSTLLVGEIRLINSQIHGGVSFHSMISNLFGRRSGQIRDNSETHKAVVDLENATVLGDLDLRNSIGLSKISGAQMKVRGTIAFANSPSYSRRLMKYDPLSGRAFYPHTDATDCTIDLSQSSVGGDVVLTFDRDAGPNLKLSSLEVGGALQILPARFGLGMTQKDLDENFPTRAKVTPHGIPGLMRPLSLFKRALFPAGKSGGKDGAKCQNETKAPRFISDGFTGELLEVMDTTRSRQFRIDMRGARAAELSHPPTAWPYKDCLRIKGLRFDRSMESGPLNPVWKSWPVAWREYLEIKQNRKLFLLSLLALVIGAIVSTWVVLGSFVTLPFSEGFEKWIGRTNFIMFLTVLAAGWIYFLVNRQNELSVSYKFPLAIRWLNLQTRHFLPNRILKGSWPLEPYLQASKVLRLSGNVDGANEVDLARVRHRTSALSWRTSGAVKVVLYLLDWYIGYGYRPVRAVIVTMAFIFLSGFLFKFAQNVDLIVPDHISSTCNVECAKGEFHFHSTIYAVDQFLPFTAVDAYPEWTLRDPESGTLLDLLYYFVTLWQRMGWVLLALIALAITSRIEGLFARSRLRE